MQWKFAGALMSILAFAMPGAARADDVEVTMLSAKLSSAAAGVSSFVVLMRLVGTTGVGGTMTFVRPLRVKTEFTAGAMKMESYFVDGKAYVHVPGGGWQVTSVDGLHADRQSVNIAEGLKPAAVKLLPDRVEDGQRLGVIQIDTNLPAAVGPVAKEVGQHLVCSYDKSSYRMQSCANAYMTMTYVKYNDPANVVILPPDAQHATPLVLPAPAAIASPIASPAAGASPIASPAAPDPVPTPSGPTTAPGTTPAPQGRSDKSNPLHTMGM